MTRRRNDAGSVRQNKSGTWSVLYTNPMGERVSLRGTFPTKAKACAALREVLVDIRRDDWLDESKSKTRFSVVAREVVNQASATWSPGTTRNNETHLRNALAEFADRPIGSVTVEQVDKWWAQHAAHPVNRRNAYFLLTTIMRFAVRWKYIRSSPCIVDKAGKNESRPRPKFTVEHLASVIGYMPDELQPVCLGAFSAHLRLGEVVGLNRGDFDLASKRLTIERQVSPVGGAHLSSTKTNNERTLRPMDPGLRALVSHVVANPMLPSAPLFTHNGERLSRRVLSAAWAKAREEAGLPDFHFHDIKRVSITHFAKTKLSLRDLMDRSGH